MFLLVPVGAGLLLALWLFRPEELRVRIAWGLGGSLCLIGIWGLVGTAIVDQSAPPVWKGTAVLVSALMVTAGLFVFRLPPRAFYPGWSESNREDLYAAFGPSFVRHVQPVNVKTSFNQGVERSMLTSYRQSLIRGGFDAALIAVLCAGGVVGFRNFWIRLPVCAVARLVYGGVASSDRWHRLL